eukprot:Skav231072  [mRNA]  locus=scaffold524:240742:241459:+ [translate_table: standard]
MTSHGGHSSTLRDKHVSLSVGDAPGHELLVNEGSPDRLGYDQHVLPNLYACARGVYAARHDQPWRVKLLQAAPEERRCSVAWGVEMVVLG